MATYTQPDCRQRLILAAGKLFAEQGLQGATTREIAREAGVNELTLFRHFHSKGNLLANVLQQVAEDQSHVRVSMNAADHDLGAELLAFARAFNTMLENYEGLIRTLIGEAHRDPASSQKVTDGAFAPWRRTLTEYLKAKQSELLPDLKLAPAVDHFLGTLLSGMLRRTCPWAPKSYTGDEFLEVSADIFARGISPCPGQKPMPKRK